MKKIIKITLLSLFYFCLFQSCSSTSDSAKKIEGWQFIFNGENLDGWEIKTVKADKNKSYWAVEQGTILANSLGDKEHDYVWLISKKEYSDFILRLKFQAFRDSPGNSGVQIRSRYDDKADWLDGPQIDIHPPGPWRTGMIWDETRESKRWLYPPIPKGEWVNEEMANPYLKFFYSDEGLGWNDLEIIAKGVYLEATLNGVKIMEHNGTGVLDDAIHKKYNVGMKGHIALQIHTKDELKIKFKDIRIKELF
jgi:hypothetical protein